LWFPSLGSAEAVQKDPPGLSGGSRGVLGSARFPVVIAGVLAARGGLVRADERDLAAKPVQRVEQEATSPVRYLTNSHNFA